MDSMNLRVALLLAVITGLIACSPVHAATWHQHFGRVLTPTLPWEGTAVGEPTIIWDRDRYRLWYTGGWVQTSLGYAESRDGVHWTKRPQPILRGAMHANVVKTTRGFAIYYVATDTFVGDTLKVARTRDGVHILGRQRVLTIRRGSWYSRSFGNTFAWRGPNGWRIMLEAAGADSIWRTRLIGAVAAAAADTPAQPLHLALSAKGMAGGPWRDGRCVYFHASRTGNLPTKIYRRCGPSLDHLGPAQVVFGLQQHWQVDQVADPSIARRPGHTPLMLFSGMDNPHWAGAIGAAWEK